jgi:hypothetical protein
MSVRWMSWSLLVGGLVLATGCADSIVSELGPENDPQVVNTPEMFEFSATDLRNINDELTFVWRNPAAKAAVRHNSFIHHGYGVLVVRDAAGVVVDSTLLSFDLDSETRGGTPGDWTLNLILAGARGRADIILTPEP